MKKKKDYIKKLKESRPTTKDTRTSGKSLATTKTGKNSKSPTRTSKPGSRSSGVKSDKEVAEIAIQDEGGDHNSAFVEEKIRTPNTRHSRRAKSTLEPVLESDYDNAFDLFDDQAWASVPHDQMSGKFAQYRRLSTHRMHDLEEQLQLTVAKTKRKVNTLKAQFQEHKSKWEAERKVLFEQVDQSLRLQTDAEKEADAAMTQLEDFITEQERLEQEEETKRSEILHASASLTPLDGLSPPHGSAVPSPSPGGTGVTLTPESEQELQRLMQQTDDAKVQELNARLGTCVSAPPAVDVDATVPQKLESRTSFDGSKVEGTTEEEIRESSAQSRASLRETFKSRLEETKSAAEDRRSQSPAIQMTPQKAIEAELILDDDDDLDAIDEEEAFPDEMRGTKDPSMYEIGTSPPPNIMSKEPTATGTEYGSTVDKLGSSMKESSSFSSSHEPSGPFKDPSQPSIQRLIKKGKTLLEHPLLQEYLKAYDSVVGFKDNMSKIFLDKDMMSAHQMTSDLETLAFDQNQNAMPQVMELTKNIYHVLEEISSLISNILVYDREPQLSSLHFISREPTQKSIALTAESVTEIPAPPVTRGVLKSADSDTSKKSETPSEKARLLDLQDQYCQLKKQVENDGKVHQDQLQRNTVVMMGMQDTINDLQRELSSLGKATKTKSNVSSRKTSANVLKAASPETSVMFTRMDSDRNAKIMKKAVLEDKLNPDKYKEAVSTMDEYVSLPAQRLAHLVKKYVHHTRMRAIEEKVKNSESVDQQVFDVLDKMETLQNQRAQQWAERMDEMGMERLKLANLLMNTLDTIEQESGIFLIKPMYSFRGRDLKPGTQGKLSRPIRPNRNMTPSNDAASSFIPAPTPASNYRLVRHERHFLNQLQMQQQAALTEMKPSEPKSLPGEGKDVKIMGNGMTFSAGSPRTTWNMQASQPWIGKDDPSSFNTPRILELDINRMLIGQNNISTKVPFPPSDDRLVNASHNSLRSYVTVNRPTATFGAEKQEKRPGSAQDSQGSARSSRKKVRVSDTDKDIPSSFTSPPPLPPILGGDGEEEQDDDLRPPSIAFTNDDEDNAREPPQSPPGSSVYQSTTRNDIDDLDEDDVPEHDRPSSRMSLSDTEN